jgi:hypothetical protein
MKGFVPAGDSTLPQYHGVFERRYYETILMGKKNRTLSYAVMNNREPAYSRNAKLSSFTSIEL